MISMSPIGDAAGAASYYTAQARLEYYANEAVPSAWGGQGVEIYGFKGPVEAQDLSQILAGVVKERGEDPEAIQTATLGRTVIDKKTGQRVTQHRPGWDLTFAPPKSVSIESEVFGVAGVRQAHELAVKTAMDYLEANAAQTRVREKMVPTGNLVYTTFAHATSRAGDPQTHTHVLVANVTYFAGKAYSLSNEQLLRQRTTADSVYRNDLAHRLNLLGYTLDYDGRGNFEIAGYNRAQLDEFSKRSTQIQTLLEERGSSRQVAGHEARQTAALATRDDKALGHSENAAAHRERWQAEALAVGIQRARPMELDLRPLPGAADLIASAAASLAEREQEFARRDLVREAMLQSSGRVSSAALLAEISTQAQAGALVRREANWTGERFTTPAAIEAERWADEQIRAGRDGHTKIMSSSGFAQALADFEARKGFALTPEQRAAARQILTSHDQFSAVQGAAGTGKTTMLEFVREAAEARGWTVQGLSNGAAQAAKLEADSGIPSVTTASFLARHQAGLAPRRDAPGQARVLYVNDEASMSGQRDFNSVIQASQDNGAKTVFVGDRAQHQSVAAGSAFERAQEQMQVSWLTQIKRQKTEQARAPVRSIIAGNHAEAIRSTAREFSSARDLVEQKWAAVATRQSEQLTRTQLSTKRAEIKAALAEDNRSAIGAIAQDYASQPAAQRENTAVITATNADRRALNEAIRNQLIAQGELQPRGVIVHTLQRKDLTRAQAAQASSYEPGDELKETLAGGATRYLQVESIDARANTLEVRDLADTARDTPGRTLGAAAAAHMAAYTRQEREFAPGDRVAFLENDRSLGVTNGDIGTVRRIAPSSMTVAIDGRELELSLQRYLQLDYGYVMTSHKAQGQTVDRTLIHHNTEGGMHGQREAYVNVTRARLKTVTYTQDRERASEQASRVVDKTRATLASAGIRHRVTGSLGQTAMARGAAATLDIAGRGEQIFVPARFEDLGRRPSPTGLAKQGVTNEQGREGAQVRSDQDQTGPVRGRDPGEAGAGAQSRGAPDLDGVDRGRGLEPDQGARAVQAGERGGPGREARAAGAGDGRLDAGQHAGPARPAGQERAGPRSVPVQDRGVQQGTGADQAGGIGLGPDHGQGRREGAGQRADRDPGDRGGYSSARDRLLALARLAEGGPGRDGGGGAAQGGGDRSRDAVDAQIAALGVERVEIEVRRYGAPEGSRREWDLDALRSSIGWLRSMNAQGHEVLMRPAGEHGLVLVDGIAATTLEAMKKDGYGPAAVVEVATGAGIYQAWVKLSDGGLSADVRLQAQRGLAQSYGGRGGHGGHGDEAGFGRLAGFANLNPGYARGEHGELRPHVLLHEHSGAVARQAPGYVQRIDNELDQAAALAERERRIEVIEKSPYHYGQQFGDPLARYHLELQDLLKAPGRLPGLAQLDHQIAVAMAKNERVSLPDIERAIAECSPNVQSMKPGAMQGYAQETAVKAWNSPEVLQHRRARELKVQRDKRQERGGRSF